MHVGTLSDLVYHVREVSSGRSDLLSVRLGGRRESLSAADFLRSVHSLALGLESRGLKRGERVTIFSENRPEWHVVDFACQLLGAPTVPLGPAASHERVGFVLRNSASRWVFFSDAEKRDLLLDLESTLTSPPALAAFDAGVAADRGTSITRLMGEGASRLGDVPIERFRGRTAEEDTASLVYALEPSGPERVELSHRQLIADMRTCDESLRLSPADLAASFAPLSEGLQRTIDHLCFYRGAAIRYPLAIDPTPAALRLERPTLLTATPAVYARCYARVRGRLERQNQPRLRLVRWGLAVGRRHAAAARGGFVGPILALQRQLAEMLVYRGLRRQLGGRLRLAVCAGPLEPEVGDFFAAWGMPVLSSASEPLSALPRRPRPRTA